MKVIFLDVDGVLNSSNYIRSYRYKRKVKKGIGFPDSDLDPIAIHHINKLCRETGAKIVLSSTWRTMDNIREVLSRNGLKADIISKTPHVARGKTRGHEIQAWLDSNDYDQYLIIDDDSDMLESQKENFIQTTSRDGFTDKHLQAAINMLNAED